MKDLHKHHSLPAMVIVWISLAQDVHHRHLALVGLCLDPREKALRQPSPPRKPLLANLLDLLSVEAVSIYILNTLSKDFPIFEQGVPQDELLDHRIVGRIDPICLKYIFAKEDVRGHL